MKIESSGSRTDIATPCAPDGASHLSKVFEDLIDVVQEVAALHQQDVVDVGAGGGLVQGQATETNVSGKVFVQHPSSCKQ